MRQGALLQAAAEVLHDIFDRHRPASLALADWGRSHRFAGSRDRSQIGTLVFDALRRRRSFAAQMQDDSPRALVLAAAQGALGLDAAHITIIAEDGPHAIGALTADEQRSLRDGLPTTTADDVRADIPEWLAPQLVEQFGARLVHEGMALAERAPVDLRANTLKGNRLRLLKAFERYGAQPTPHALDGVRIPPPGVGERSPAVEKDAAHGKGWFEVQDEGSQLAAMLTNAKPRMQVLDLCAGAGGKTLALAAAMQNTGQLYAYDRDKTQLRPIFDRMRRAGVRNVQVLEAGDEKGVAALGPRFDVVLVDAPCSGSGTWRRKPDSKWRLTDAALADRIAEQQAALHFAAPLVKSGGRLVYVTCSILAAENQNQSQWFLSAHQDFKQQSNLEVWQDAFGDNDVLKSADGSECGLLLTPAQHGTDGFFIASFIKAG